jgi:hypothetical protein
MPTWITPTPTDAMHWPRVEIRHEGDTDWTDGYFLASVNQGFYVVMPEDALGKTSTMMYWHRECRMKASERQRWQSK